MKGLLVTDQAELAYRDVLNEVTGMSLQGKGFNSCALTSMCVDADAGDNTPDDNTTGD